MSRYPFSACRRVTRLAGAVTAGTILVGTLAAVPALASSVRTQPQAPVPKPVPYYIVHGHPAKVPAVTPWHPPATSWPAPGSATALPGPGAVRAGSLPVWAAAVPRTAAPGKVRVTVAAQQAASAVGVHGVVFTVGRADGRQAAAPLRLSVNYSSFAYAYGGAYASRLHLVELPACALTTPQVPICRTQVPLASADNVQADSIGATVRLPASGTVVVAATASTSGSGGDYTATSLSEAGSWSAGGESGAFTYSYPISVPAVPGGLKPSVSLDYDSQAVDGLTSSTNNQASWIGDGWDYSPGYIERNYESCEQNSGADKTGDFCYSPNDTTTVSLLGQSTTLVNSGGTWHPEDDNAEKVSYQATGPTTSNGTHDNGYWVVTQTNGDKYYFGLNELPGYASGDPTTNSTWTLPVYATASGQPCYNATFSESHCAMAWRWNLDYVTDPHGDAIAYFYNDETNYYASDNGTTANASYVQGGALKTIEYGLRADGVYGATPAAQVNFTIATDRTDIPSDLACSNGAACSVISPTFWTKYRLTTIATQALEGSALASVDSWSLSQSYPSTGDTTTPPALWLGSITRTGEDGGPVMLPPVSFGPTAMPNRVETPTDTTDGYSIITRMRLTTITDETGGSTTIGYAAPGGACTSGNFPSPDANTLPCYPDYWSPSGTSSPVLDWFNKYAVSYITQTDTTGAGVPVTTSYSYSGAAWHYDDDALTRSSQRTWDQWRGYRTVTTETGTSPDPVTKTVDTYLQGMNGDYQSGGGTSSVSVTSSRGDTVTDSDQFAGLNFESIAYNGTGGGEVTDTITLPWTSAATGTQSQPSPLPALKSFLTGTAEAKVYTILASGGTQESDTTYTHDPTYGRVTATSSVPDTSDASQDTCTTTSYADNTSAWIVDLASEVKVVSVPCGTTPALPADAVSDKITLYDGATALSSNTPSKGDVTQTELATAYSGSTPAYTTQSKATYDEYGRVLTATDADNRTTTTSYTPATGAEPAQDTVTDPKGLVTTTTYDPARDLPLVTTSPAGLATTEQYDALGRLTAVWTPGNATTGPANDKFSYAVSNSGPSYTISSALAPDGTSYTEQVAIYDSLGRARETQQQLGDGTWNVTDTVYDSAGNQTLTSGPYYEESLTPGKLIGAPEDEVPAQDGKVYDGDGRVIKDIAYAAGIQTWETDTAYGGNYTTTTYSCASSQPSCGGTPQTTFTDGRGLTTAIYQYHAGVAASPSDPGSDYGKTSYAYWPSKKLKTITDASGDTWSYAYDLSGNQTQQADPDSGTTTSTYDAAGQQLTSTDARGKQVSYVYDSDGRKTAEYDTTGGAAESSSDEIASWTYDTLAKGEPSSSSSYYNGQAYTEAILGYNSSGLPTGTYVTVPSGQGKLAGNYVTEDKSYAPTGQLLSYEDSTAGGLPTETVNYAYNEAGQPTQVEGTWAYVYSLSYSEYGKPQEYEMGSGSEPAYVMDSYDSQTLRLTEQQTSAGVTPSVVDDLHYRYDNVGDVLWENDTPASGPTQAQCFKYDYLGRLTQAWSQGSACTPSSSPSTTAESGAAAPYWDTYAYNAIGDLTSQTSTSASGQVTTTTGTFPAPGAPQPHAATSEQVSGGSPGTTSYSYDADGHMTGVSGSQSQSLSWDDAGRLASITSPASASSPTTSYLYDADGNLLIERDPGQTTLFLPDEQIVLNTSAGTLSGTRYYSIGGVTVAARTSSGSVSYLVGDQQGTASVSIDSGTLAVTRRYYDPYGNEIGTPPASWPGVKGFVGGTADSATGLTNLGAREYQPATAQFVSPDPLISPYDPQDLNAYGYSKDNPATYSDSSGQKACPDGQCSSGEWKKNPCGIGVSSSHCKKILKTENGGNSSNLDCTLYGGLYTAYDQCGPNDPTDCWADCGSPVRGVSYTTVSDYRMWHCILTTQLCEGTTEAPPAPKPKPHKQINEGIHSGGFCITGTLAFGIGGSGSVCIIDTRQGFGLTESLGWTSGWGWGIEGAPVFSENSKLSDYRGWSGNLDACLVLCWDQQLSRGSQGNLVQTWGFGVGPKAGFTTGGSYTWVQGPSPSNIQIKPTLSPTGGYRYYR